LMQVMQQNDGGEEKLRKEIIEQGKKMNELKAESEKHLYQMQRDFNSKIDLLNQKHSEEMKK
jgi:hypothetical protein